MRTRSRIALTLACLSALPGAVSAQRDFEGTFSMKIAMDGTTTDVTGYAKGTRSRQDMVVDGAQVAMIMDSSDGSMIMIDHEKKRYVELGKVIIDGAAMVQDSTESRAPAPELKSTSKDVPM